jgi:lysophospholipase L1-like esterase
MPLQSSDLVVFQGDSITDAGRSRQDGAHLGSGYAALIAAWYAASHPERRVRFLNRGISGNRVRDLRARWGFDCLDLRPNVVSILIGVNDTLRRYDGGDATSPEEYEAEYRAILEDVRPTGARTVILEPFLLPAPPTYLTWRVDLDPKIHVARSLAREFSAVYVPLDGLFAAAAARREPGFWAADGVHPSAAGHALIAQAWLEAVEREA